MNLGFVDALDNLYSRLQNRLPVFAQLLKFLLRMLTRAPDQTNQIGEGLRYPVMSHEPPLATRPLGSVRYVYTYVPAE